MSQGRDERSVPMPGERGERAEFGLFFQLPQADGQDVPQRYRDTIAQIVHADRIGFDAAWLAEMHFVREFSVLPSPMVAMAAAAAQTDNIRLGTGVALLPLVDPIRAAEDAATLDIISNGRLEYGIGRGAIGEHFAGFNVSMSDRAARFDEALSVIQQAWSDDPVNFEGEHFNYRDVQVVPKPVQRPGPPLRMAANSDESFLRAANEGWRVFASPITAFEEDLDNRFTMYHGARPHAPATDAGLLLPVYVHESSETAREQARESLLSYFKVVTDTGIRGWLRRGGTLDDMPPLLKRNREASYDEVLETMCAIGNPDEVTAKLSALGATYGVGHFLTWCNAGGVIPHDQVTRSMSLFMKECAPNITV
ncbi:MAG: LLM class flavin-dependent oxidoreductase [Chloroflexi bacterium]|nr:LLM class flavin-dependent oxidoreductase [Chloroflexota bacterium]